MHSFLNQTDRDSGYTLLVLLLVLTLTALLMLTGSGDPQCSLLRGAAETSRCFAPYTNVYLSVSTTGELSLGGVRHTAGAAHLVLSNSAGRLRVVLSGRGRVRLCSEQGRWAGIPPC